MGRCETFAEESEVRLARAAGLTASGRVVG